MDSESAERFLNLLRAKDRDPLQTALSRMGLIRREDDPVLPRELSIARLPTLPTGFCAFFDCARNTKVLGTWAPAGSFAGRGLVYMNYVLAPLTEKESVHGVLIRMDPGARTEMHHRR